MYWLITILAFFLCMFLTLLIDESFAKPWRPYWWYKKRPKSKEINVCAFNVQSFGVTKAGKPEIMKVLAKVSANYNNHLVKKADFLSIHFNQ